MLTLTPQHNSLSTVTHTFKHHQQQHRTGQHSTVLALSLASVVYIIVNNDDNTAHAADTLYKRSDIQQPIDLLTHKLSQAALPITGSDVMLAPRYKRVIAAILDSMLISGISRVFVLLFGASTATFISPLAANVLYDIGNNVYFNGQTLGKMLLSIRTIRNDGRDIGLYTATVLYVGKLFNIFLGVDVLVSLFDTDKQCVHNKLTDTVVVNSVSPINTLFEAKSLLTTALAQ